MAISSTGGGDHPTNVPPPTDPARLPSSKSDELELVVATFAEHMQTSRLNGNEWKGPLTIEQYLKREKHLLAQDLTKDGKEVAWLLTSARLPVDECGSRSILASCETIPMQAFVARNGELKQVLVHGIGSVFTRSEHRGKSYASRMMVELGKKLETFQQPNGDRSPFSVLYSDIGQKFYARFGWEAFPSTHIHLSALDAQEYQELSSGLPLLTDLMANDLHSVRAVDWLKDDLVSSSEAQPDKAFVAIAPDMEHFKWHHAREDFVSRTLAQPSPKVKGTVHQESGTAMIWTRTFVASKADWMLHVLHVAIPPALVGKAELRSILAALLLRAQNEASLSGMVAGVELWDPSEEIVTAARQLRCQKGDDVQVIHRDQEHICSLRWTDSAVRPSEVVWKHRSKYAWC